MKRAEQKAARVAEVNKLLKSISNFGRRFFYSKQHDRVASMMIGKTGHVYFVDDYSGKPIYTAYQGHWRGFSHGGTLKSLVQALAEYIRTGKQLSMDWIGPERFDQSNIWGYAADEMAKCRAEVALSPVIKQRAAATQPKEPLHA
ncbi:hypothetical protein [Massilia phyllosphaerae]|uniref:hypothetical protein n=1 Tax=Massilia phyllosphaerae TaxID=3106034 RepID=UPI002B1CB806|nr:hypothetical protein [Massilia sp. SGZ-792]